MIFKVKFSENSKHIAVGFGELQKVSVPDQEHEEYAGEYTVTPKSNAQVLPTARKLMAKDLEVKAIPFYETSNTAGGNTIYIGNEVI